MRFILAAALVSAAALVGPITRLAAQAPPALIITSQAFNDGETMPKQHSSIARSKNISPALSWSGAPEGTRQFAVILEDAEAALAAPSITVPFQVYWIAYQIPGSATGLPEDLAPGPITSGPLAGTMQGMSDFDRPAPRERPSLDASQAQNGMRYGSDSMFWSGLNSTPTPRFGVNIMSNARPPIVPRYRGPMAFSDIDSKPHHFRFTVYAIDAKLKLKEGLDKRQLLDAITGHVVAHGQLTSLSR